MARTQNSRSILDYHANARDVWIVHVETKMKPNGVLVLGAGVSGMSCVRHLHGKRDLIICDTRFDTDQSPIPNSKTFYQNFPHVSLIKQKDFGRAIDSVSTLIVSPGLPLNHCLVKKALSSGIELVSDIDLFMESKFLGVLVPATTSSPCALIKYSPKTSFFPVDGFLVKATPVAQSSPIFPNTIV